MMVDSFDRLNFAQVLFDFAGFSLISYKAKYIAVIVPEFVFCCLMTPGLSKDIQCHVRPYSFLCLQLARLETS